MTRDLGLVLRILRFQSRNVLSLKHLCYDDGRPYSEADRAKHFALLVSTSVMLAESVLQVSDTLMAEAGRQP